MDAIIYTRVSTTGQAEDGVSLEAQARRARAWADANGCEVAAVHSDAGISGKRAANRPGLQAALDAACENGGALVVYSLSRLARSTKDAILIAERLDKAGADLVSLSESLDTTTAAGKMMFRIFAVLAEFERDLVSERTKAAKAHLREQGRYLGGKVPFGFQVAEDGEHLEEDPDEQATLADLQSMRACGWSWRKIAEELNRRGVPTKEGQPWTWQTTRRLAA